MNDNLTDEQLQGKFDEIINGIENDEIDAQLCYKSCVMLLETRDLVCPSALKTEVVKRDVQTGMAIALMFMTGHGMTPAIITNPQCVMMLADIFALNALELVEKYHKESK